MIIVNRRTFVLAPVLGSLAWLRHSTTGLAQGGAIALILELSELLSKMADAVSKLGDSVAHVATIGAQAYDAVVARRAHSDLIELRVGLEGLVATQQPLVASINQYVAHVDVSPKPSAEEIGRWWMGIVDRVKRATERVDALLKDVNNVSNDFVLQDAYRTIQQALNARVSLLEQLRALPAPVDKPELQVLAKAGQEYQKLLDATLKASEQLAAYVSSLK